ncbi:MAG TPA: hypothetical protein VI933_02670 [archaeon]|nr:hypothetical protein [archaeon]
MNKKMFIALFFALVALAAFVAVRELPTGFAVFTEKSGEYFAVTISGENDYAFSFKNLKNETLSNVSANLTFSAGANISNYGNAALISSETSKILSWVFDSISAGVNTSLSFTSDSDPTEAKISAVNEAGSGISETTTVTISTTTTTAANATTTTATNVTTTTMAETTTTTLEPFDYDEEGGAEIYTESFKKKKDNGVPEGWYLRKTFDLGITDDEFYPAQVELEGKKVLKVTGILSDDKRFYSDAINWTSGKIRVKLFYKPIGNQSCIASAVFGFEVFFQDGSSDTTLFFHADNSGSAFSAGGDARDFDVKSDTQKDGWYKISAKSMVSFDSSRILRFFISQPLADCGTGFYVREVSIK